MVKTEAPAYAKAAGNSYSLHLPLARLSSTLRRIWLSDLEEEVAVSAEADAQTLRRAGYSLTWALRFFRSSSNGPTTVERDELCGYRLHRADAAVNKMLAMAGGVEVRDFVDVLHLDAEYLALGALAWAACGKDPGFSPDFLLDHAAAHTAYRPADLARLNLRVPLELPIIKRQWLEALDRARALVHRLPDQEVGCLYLERAGLPINPDPSSDRFQALRRHHGSVGGAWPSVF